MRLTVHVANARQETDEVKTKDGIVNKKKTYNTLAFSDINPSDVERILKEIEAEGHGIPMKHYLSGEKIKGHTRVKKK
jgi:hypothetical protein